MKHAAPYIAWEFHRVTGYVRGGMAPSALPSPSVRPDPRFWHPQQMKEYPSARRQKLPPPEPVPMALEEAIARRGSCRRFAEGPLPLSLLSTLLRHAYGLGESYRMGEWAAFNRPVPSGGGCYPLELYLFVRQVDGVEAGTYHYCARDHALELLGAVPSLNLVEELFLGQPWLARAQVVLVVSAVPARLLHRYGERGYRYLLLEAGHVGQNLSLLATATGSGSLCLGGFLDDALTTVLGLDPMLELPMYGVAVGMPESPNQLEARALDLF